MDEKDKERRRGYPKVETLNNSELITLFFRYIDRQYELQGYRIPLPESEELCVPEPEGVDLEIVPAEYLTEYNSELIIFLRYLTEEAQSEEAAHSYARERAGVKPDEKERTPSPPRFEEITDVD